eukprot:CAMPEP_0116945024 /NCGR_PEP_ID=MMETSP0467-20121206/36122_1 /TAXON_ID=283647 /ORGANISM="Mesodinium pulex, Strain SPMC105" /LENGTH=318 /DNA_ID=CAMNT_0004628489 /DNA_START=1646 /DNA_END=2602 /DNA_ORIENTATION=-
MNTLEVNALTYKKVIEDERKELATLNMIRKEKQLETEIKQNESSDYIQHIESYFNKSKDEMKDFLNRIESDEKSWTDKLSEYEKQKQQNTQINQFTENENEKSNKNDSLVLKNIQNRQNLNFKNHNENDINISDSTLSLKANSNSFVPSESLPIKAAAPATVDRNIEIENKTQNADSTDFLSNLKFDHSTVSNSNSNSTNNINLNNLKDSSAASTDGPLGSQESSSSSGPEQLGLAMNINSLFGDYNANTKLKTIQQDLETKQKINTLISNGLFENNDTSSLPQDLNQSNLQTYSNIDNGAIQNIHVANLTNTSEMEG